MGLRLLPELRARGYELVVVTGRGKAELPDLDAHDGIPIHRFSFHQVLKDRDLDGMGEIRRRIAALKAAFGPDLVHVNFCDPGIFFHLATERTHPAATLITVRLSITQEEAGADSLLGRAFRSAGWVATNSGFVLDGIRKLVPEIIPRSSVIYNGLDLPDLAPVPLPFQPPRLLGLGRLVPDKGFDLAVAAFARIAARFPEARLVLAGDGTARPALERQAGDLGLLDRIEFPGWIRPDEIPALLNSSTLVLLPSRWQEAFGLVALQAAQMARPVVATRVGGIPEVVAHGETGLLVEPEDPESLGQAVAELLANPARAAAMGEVARARAARLFSFTTHAEAYDRLYRRLVRGER